MRYRKPWQQNYANKTWKGVQQEAEVKTNDTRYLLQEVTLCKGDTDNFFWVIEEHLSRKKEKKVKEENIHTTWLDPQIGW